MSWTAQRVTAVLAAFALAGLVWGVLDVQRDRWTMERAQSATDEIMRLVERDLTIRLTGSAFLRAVTEHGQNSDMVMRDFERTAGRIFDVFPGVHAVALFDTESGIRSLVPAGLSPPERRFSTDNRPELTQALGNLRAGDNVVFATGLQLTNTRSTGFIAFKALGNDSDPRGVLALIFAADEWFNHLIFSSEHPDVLREFSVRITLNDAEVYNTPGFAPATDGYFESRRLVLGTPMRVQAEPHGNAFGLLWTSTPELVALLVAGLALFGVAAVAQTQDARKSQALSAQIASDLKALNAKLYQEIEVRRAAQETAQDARRMMANFLATMSHEVRTPLNAIMGMFELIENGETSDRARRQAHAGRGAAQRLFSELTNVLDVSRLDAHAIDIATGPVDLTTAVAHWRETLEALVENAHKDIHYTIDIGPEVQGIAQFDFDRVTQIVTNLMDNAVKFTASGTVGLVVQTHDRDVIIRICDTGSGIAPERQELVFKRFYQVDSGLNRRHNGAGLGLAICQELSQLMGFDLRLEASHACQDTSNISVTGSTFLLTLSDVVFEPCASPAA